MNHKYGRKKDSRAGCLMCKSHKANAYVGQDRQARKRDVQREIDEAQQAADEEEQERFWKTATGVCPDCKPPGSGKCDDCPDGICVLCGGTGRYD